MVLVALLRLAGLDETMLSDIALTGAEPALPSSFAVGTAAQAAIAATALAAARLWRLGAGRRQRVSVDMRDAAIEFRSERYLRVEGKYPADDPDRLSGLYRCGDGRWVRLHTSLPHHYRGMLGLLRSADDRAAVQRALDHWEGEALEAAAADAGLVAAACRTFAEWNRHPQGRAITALPLLSIEQIGDAPPEALSAAARPLAGIRVLDLTRIIAGPVCGRALAVHGADVLLVGASHLPSLRPLVVDTGRGKLSAFIDLREARGREALAVLAGPPTFSRRATGRASSPRWASALRRSQRSGPASSLCHCAPTATTDPGQRVAASIHSCRPQAASTPRKRRPSAPASRSRCRGRRSTTPPVI